MMKGWLGVRERWIALRSRALGGTRLWILWAQKGQTDRLCQSSRWSVNWGEKRERLCRKSSRSPWVPTIKDYLLAQGRLRRAEPVPQTDPAWREWDRYRRKRRRHLPCGWRGRLLTCRKYITVGDWRIALGDYVWQEQAGLLLKRGWTLRLKKLLFCVCVSY